MYHVESFEADATDERTWEAQAAAVLDELATQGWRLVSACERTVTLKQTGGIVSGIVEVPRMTFVLHKAD
jgi:hypothetical protein